MSLLTSAPTALIRAVAKAARELRYVRAEALRNLKGGLRALYRTLELPGANPLMNAHAVLDAAVMAAYGFDTKQGLLAQLLNLNLDVAAKIERGESVTAPGVPKGFLDPETLVTADCLRPTGEDVFSDGSTAESYAAAAHFYSAKEAPAPYE